MILLLATGAIDLASVNADKTTMQDAADAAALAMAKQLSVATPTGIAARAKEFVAAQLGPIMTADSVSVATSVASDNNSVTVTLTGHRGSFFGSLLPPGGWNLASKATAQTLGALPLCVLSFGPAGGQDLHMAGQSLMTASACLVQSNGDIAVDGQASLVAGLAQAAGNASGAITPAAQSGAPAIADPFASMNVSVPANSCSSTDNVVYSGGANTLAPGVHCGNITVENGASLQLLPGEHYFAQGQLQMQNASSLTGSDVVLVFDKSSQFNFADSAVIDLSGRTAGDYAGFVIATTRDNTGAFTISSNSAEKLEGAIYIPSATLKVEGSGNKVAEQSAWTVVVAQSLQLDGSADLVINSNYASSSVPVPGGVGASANRAVVLAK